MSLPAPRTPGSSYKVELVCLGNICRSPMAHVVLEALVRERGLDVEVSSSGTGGWHVGGPMDHRAAATLTGVGYDASRHRARQFRVTDADLVLTMDADNLATVRRLVPAAEHDRVRPFRAFDPSLQPGEAPDVPDPYYGADDGFTTVLAMVERTARALVDELEGLAKPSEAWQD